MQDVTIRLPDGMYQQLKSQADAAHCSVEADVVQVVRSAVAMAGEMTADLEALLDQLRFLDDSTLHRAAQTRLAKRAFARLAALNAKRQRDGLTPADAIQAQDLMTHYERAMLIRAEALALLKERGHDITPLLGV